MRNDLTRSLSSRRSLQRFSLESSHSIASSDVEREQSNADSQSGVRKHMRTIERMVVERLLPNSTHRLVWELFIFLVIWYNSVMTPIRLFILGSERTPPVLIAADLALDIIFVIDTVLHFFRPFIDKDTKRVVTSLRLIRGKYLRSFTFYTNAIACIPILKAPLSPFLDDQSNIAISTNFNILRMIRILHFPDQFEELKQYLSRKDPVNESVFRMGVILFFTQLIMCIFGSVYFGLSTAQLENVCTGPEAFADEVMTSETWIAEDGVITDLMDIRVCSDTLTPECESCPSALFFLRSVYFVMQTLFTIGYGDSVVPSRLTIELVMACIFMLSGVFGYALIIANMTSVLSNIDVVRMRFRHEMDNVNKLLTLRSVPEALKERIEMYFSYLFRSQNGMLDSVLFSHLPEELSKSITGSNRPLIQKVPFFKPEHRTPHLLNMIANGIEHRIYPPGCTILYEGEKQRELIIVKKGRVDLYLRDVKESIGNLVEGDYLGAYQLLFNTVNQVGARCTEFTEVLLLTFPFFEKVINHPLQEDIDFIALEGNFRQSDDPGALETMAVARIRIKKIATSMSKMKNIPKSKKIMNMLEETEVKVKGVRIMPNSPLNVYWDVFMVIAIMYDAIACPIYFATFYRSSVLDSGHKWSFFIQYFFDFVFAIDIYLRMNAYAYTCFDGGTKKVVVDRKLLRTKYLNSRWFFVDIIAVLPFDLLSLILGHYTLFRIPKLVRISQLSPCVSRLGRNLDSCMGIIVSETHVSSFNMFLSTVLIVVWSSAGWSALRLKENAAKSVYWALTTLTTVGYGDVVPSNKHETIYAILVGAAGATFTASIIANVTSFFHDVDISEDNIDHKANCVKRFMETKARPLEQVAKMKDYFEYIEREQEGINEDLLLRKGFPEHLRVNILTHLTHSMVLNCTYFSDCEAAFLRKIMTSLSQQFYGAKSMVLSSSIPSDGMFFVKKGTVGLVKESQGGAMKEIKRLGTDGYFAEECLLQYWEKNPYLAMAVTDCELWHLNRVQFRCILNDFPNERVMLSEVTSSSRKKECRRKSIKHASTISLNSAPVFYFHPNDYFIQFWLGLILFVTVYFVIALPFRLAFMESYDISRSWLILDYTGDILLCIDIIIRSRFLAYIDDNHLVSCRKKIWSHYIQSKKMKWHALSILPMEFIALKMPTLCPLWTLQVWSLFRMNKMLRLVEVNDLSHHVETSLVKIGVKVPKNAIRVGKLLMVISLSAHFVACIFYMIATFNQYLYWDMNGGQQNWADDEGLFNGKIECPGSPVTYELVIQRYVASLYWSMATLTTVGYGDITANENSIFEIIFATLILIVGTCIYTLVIALLEDIVSQLDVTSSLHKLRTDKVASFCKLEALPDTLKAKIDAHYEHLWQMQRGVNGEKILSFFPIAFRSNMLLDMLSPLLHQTFFIKDCSTDFIGHILKFITSELYLSDDVVFYEGQKCSELLFLHRGNVDLLTSKNVKFKSVSDCILGEASFFGFEPHLCSAKAETSCEMFLLSMQDFMACVHENDYGKKFKEYLLQNEKIILQSKASITKMINNLKSSKMAKMHIIQNETFVPKGVVLPESLFRNIWDFLLLLQTVTFVFTIPYQISFLDSQIALPFFLLDVCIDICLSFDIYARLTKFAVTNDGSLVVEPTEFRAIYLKSNFAGDLISAIPASLVGYLCGIRDRRYGLLRLFQLIRARHFGGYFSSLVENMNAKARVSVSTAQMRVMQIFFIVLFLCHWFACIYHLLGRVPTHLTWLEVDESMGADKTERYLRSFYWSLYTVTTVGYGSIPVITNSERIFAMFVMAAGAVICDAGITAILTSIISIRDQQSGTNRRRIQCFKTYMDTNALDNEIHQQVLDYYKYVDNELKNIEEADILEDLSTTLRIEILRHFCFEQLRALNLFHSLTDGALNTIVTMMEPYLAVQSEKLSFIGKTCEHLYVLKRGEVVSTDSSGMENYLPFGAIIGHIASDSSFKEQGLPTQALEIHVHRAKGFKTKWGNPYITFNIGSTVFRSSIKKTKSWRESVMIKLSDKKKEPLGIIIKSWQSGQVHSIIGKTDVTFEVYKKGGIQHLVVEDDQGKCVGFLSLSVTLRKLDAHEYLYTHEQTSTALGYCHLYRVDCHKLKELETYLKLSDVKGPEKRLDGQLFGNRRYEYVRSKGKTGRFGRSSSIPSLDSNLVDQNEIREISKFRVEKELGRKTFRNKRSATIVPERNEEHIETGTIEQIQTRRVTWAEPPNMKASHQNVDQSEKEPPQKNSEVLKSDHDWNILCKLSSDQTNNKDVVIEWTDDFRQ